MIRLAIVGTRVLDCRQDREKSRLRIWGAIETLRPDVVISGGAKGIDLLAAEVAVERGYSEDVGSLIIHRPSQNKFHGPGGYLERDELIAQDCTHLLRVACIAATTYGSGWTADRAAELGKVVVRWSPCR